MASRCGCAGLDVLSCAGRWPNVGEACSGGAQEGAGGGICPIVAPSAQAVAEQCRLQGIRLAEPPSPGSGVKTFLTKLDREVGDGLEVPLIPENYATGKAPGIER